MRDRLAQALRAHRDDEGAAMLITMMIMLLVASVSIGIAGAVLAERMPTLVQQKRTRTVNVAEAGLDVGLNRLRAAVNSAGQGQLSKLPCTAASSATLTGSVGSGQDTGYTVTIRYYDASPTDQTATWRSSNALGCVSSAPAHVPAYALIQSTGSGSAVPGRSAGTGNRSLEATYAFNTTNVNVLGGLIYDYTSGTGQCLAADSLAVGQNVRIQACNASDSRQTWSYTKDLFLQVISPAGEKLCVSAPSTTAAEATLAACSTSDLTQIWSFNDSGRFVGTTDNVNTNDFCLSVNTLPSGQTAASVATINKKIVILNGCGGGYDTRSTFSPTAKVGAGKAGDSTSQLVNYQFFGRCLDITGKNVSAGYEIGYPCKMAPSNTKIAWNQKFFWDAATAKLCTDTANPTLTSCAPGPSTYCLTAGTSGTVPSGTRVLLKPCSAGNTYQRWTRRFGTGTYTNSYNIVTRNDGLCMELNPDGAAEASAYDRQWGVVQVATCNGLLNQKWNAPANLVDSRIDGLRENAPTPSPSP